MLYNMMLEGGKRVSTVKFALDGLDGYGLEDLSNELRRDAALLPGKSTTRPALNKIAKVHSSTMSRLIFFWINISIFFKFHWMNHSLGPVDPEGPGRPFLGHFIASLYFRYGPFWCILCHHNTPTPAIGCSMCVQNNPRGLFKIT
jgi:hypothetical protein